MQKHPTLEPPPAANQTVRVKVDTASGSESIRISFTDQRLTAYGGMAVWSHFLHQKSWRARLSKVLPHDPTSPNAYEPTDIALGFMGGILSGADKLSRVAWLQSDPAMAEVLGIEAVPSQSTLSRFFGIFSQKSSTALSSLHATTLFSLPSRKEGYTLDLDSWSLLHEDGHQEGVALGYTRLGPKPCHRSLLACVAEAKMVANYWLRRGDAHCVNNAAEFLRTTLAQKPTHLRYSLLRADTGFAAESVLSAAEEAGLPYIIAWRFDQKVQRYCRHDDASWSPTDIAGLEIQEVEMEQPGRRLIVIRQRIAERPQAGGKQLLDVPGYRFQSLLTNLPPSLSALEVWRRYNGRGDSENRIRELGDQFGIKRLCCRSFWATEAMHHLAIAAYNLCVLLQRRLGQLEKCELNTLRWRLFARAAVWSRTHGKPTLKLAVRGEPQRHWWLEILAKLTAPPNCNAIGSLQA
jgi:DNA-directed RNA polymerase subunit N (RpoN/RPB10)